VSDTVIFKGAAISGGIAIGTLVIKEHKYPIAPAGTPLLLAADELSPAEVLACLKSGITSFIFHRCSETAHAAILARGMETPSLYGIRVPREYHGSPAIIDGDSGTLIVEPDAVTLAFYHTRLQDRAREEEELRALVNTPTLTKNGKQITLAANVNKLSDLTKAIENGAEGIFFKTEFLFLEAKDYPTEDEQFEVYRAIASRMKQKRAVIRTADIGADKTADYFALDSEENPALGIRGIRLSLRRPELFLTQLRAILRASAYGNLAIMLPMITSPEEITAARAMIRRAEEELTLRGEPYRESIPLGIMIETPASAILCDELARSVDFFSIGTNDLTQYVLAADRQAPALSELYDPRHRAVKALLRYVIERANANGIEVGISGELAQDTEILPELVRCGLSLLAVPPTKLLPIKKAIGDISE